LYSRRGFIRGYLGAKAITDRPEFGHAVLLLQILDGGLDDRVDSLDRVRVLAIRAMVEPLHEIETFRSVERQGISVEHVDDDGVVAVGGELVGNELAVEPDADDIGDEDQADALVALVRWRYSQVGIPLVSDLDRLPRCLTPAKRDEGGLRLARCLEKLGRHER